MFFILFISPTTSVHQCIGWVTGKASACKKFISIISLKIQFLEAWLNLECLWKNYPVKQKCKQIVSSSGGGGGRHHSCHLHVDDVFNINSRAVELMH